MLARLPTGNLTYLDPHLTPPPLLLRRTHVRTALKSIGGMLVAAAAANSAKDSAAANAASTEAKKAERLAALEAARLERRAEQEALQRAAEERRAEAKAKRVWVAVETRVLYLVLTLHLHGSIFCFFFLGCLSPSVFPNLNSFACFISPSYISK
jgi:hypothetical protein